MHDTKLHVRLREHGIDSIWEAFEAIHAGNQDILYAAMLQLGQYVQRKRLAIPPSL